MLNLIKKDLILQKRYLIVYGLLLCFYLWSKFDIAYVTVIVSSLFVMNSHYCDDKDHANILLNALPYTRKEIVSSKYIGAMLFTAAVIPVCIVVRYMVNAAPLMQLSIKDIVLSFLLMMLFVTFYLPFFYKFPQRYLLIAGSIVFIFLLIFIQRIPVLLKTYFSGLIMYFAEFSETQLYLIFSLIVIVGYGLSWLLSIRIYQKKAF